MNYEYDLDARSRKTITCSLTWLPPKSESTKSWFTHSFPRYEETCGFNHLPTKPGSRSLPPFCSSRGWAAYLEHEVFVEVGIKVGEVITARRAPPLAPLVGQEAHSEKGDSFVISLSQASNQRVILGKQSMAIHQCVQGWTKRLRPGLVNWRRKIAFSCLLQPGERNFSPSNSPNLAEAF